jgi:hypothetical protein
MRGWRQVETMAFPLKALLFCITSAVCKMKWILMELTFLELFWDENDVYGFDSIMGLKFKDVEFMTIE